MLRSLESDPPWCLSIVVDDADDDDDDEEEEEGVTYIGVERISAFPRMINNVNKKVWLLKFQSTSLHLVHRSSAPSCYICHLLFPISASIPSSPISEINNLSPWTWT